MNAALQKKIDVWNAKYRNYLWNGVPTGLSVYAAFSGCYGFRLHNGFGWERVHTLAFATRLQDHRKHGGNWKSFWRSRKYSM